MATQITAADFQSKVLDESVPVLVDFFATWCGPCKMMGPILDEVSEELGDKARIYKVDVDRETELAQRFNIMSVPTFYVFKDGKPVDTFMGAVPKQAIIKALS